MEKSRLLIITHELDPYVAITEIANTVSKIPLRLHDEELEIRVLMPRFSTINERRHRLHEVVRLSGINIEVDGEDYPLIIKVAALPGARLQVYFLDNEDLFWDRNIYCDEDGDFHDENLNRMVFFCQGALETVIKFGWPPKYIQCHGWMTSVIPALLKTQYADNPVFADAQLMYTVYPNEMAGSIAEDFADQFLEDTALTEEDLAPYGTGSEEDLHKGAIFYADHIALTKGVDESVVKASKDSKKTLVEINRAEEAEEVFAQFYVSREEENV
ncbi:MAG: glycogen/starch synthase [Bacteroidota bacterium]|nr:glycogen/starch synthase [Bacteroidota bacterium]